MSRKNLLDPLPPVDLEELTRESETFDCSVPLASSGEFFSDDAELPTHSISWRTPVSPAEKKLKKRFRKSKKNLLHTQKELQATEKQLEVCQRQNAQLLHAVEQERLARDRAEADNTARQVALVISEAIHRGKAKEAFQDLAFGGTDALLSRGNWLFQGGNIDRTVPHRNPGPHGYLLPDKDWWILDDQPNAFNLEGGGNSDE